MNLPKPSSVNNPRGNTSARESRILLIEDDPSITVGLRMNLENEGFSVVVEADGESGLQRAREGHVDLLIVDVMLPRLNGFELIRQLRREGKTMPIIVLSARSSEIDKVMGLELGADDYLTKPFGLAELLARVRVALRRNAPPSRAVILRLGLEGELELDEGTREVRREGVSIELTATEFDVLMALAEAKGRVLSRERILEAIYGPGHHGTARTIDNFLMQLRNKLELDPQSPKYLVTVRGVGYRLVG